MNPTVFVLMRNQEFSMWVVPPLSITVSLSFPPSHLDCYPSRSSRCVLITIGLRETQLGDEAHFSLIVVVNLLHFQHVISPAVIIIVRAQLHLFPFDINKMLFNLHQFLVFVNFIEYRRADHL